MSLHLKHATKLAMIKGIVDESFIITQYRFTVTPVAGAKRETHLAVKGVSSWQRVRSDRPERVE
jgi:hypothetical protein